WKGKHLGQFGQGAIFSFQWGKPYTTGQGGMVTINSEEIAKRIDILIDAYASRQSFKKTIIYEIERKIRLLTIKTNLETLIRSLYKSLKKNNKRKDICNFNLASQSLKGYIVIPDFMTIKEGLRQLGNYTNILIKRRRNVEVIETLLEEKNIMKWDKLSNAELTLLRYPVFVSNKQEILKKSLKKGWDIAGWYDSPVHPLLNKNLEMIGYKKGSAPNAEKLIEQLVHFPTYNITKDKLRLIVETLF
ncbi:MAG: DegT/DnrJ/EryC1/StrS family aminotransferase, partial [Phycisphaerae bacterium]|nr:DegT/DnrJ/EryC1/StrS family aminotransferase [Phycisphaerae bacterium]